MLALPVARVVEHRRRGVQAAEWSVVSHINPTSRGIALAQCQHRHGRVITVQAFGRQDVGFDELQQRFHDCASRAHRIRQGGQADRHALTAIPLGLPVQRLMLAELLEQDHGQQARSRPSARDHVERRRRLTDVLAVPAAELLPHGLDHLP